jgi:DNA-binding NtrC family response regulator
MLDGLPGDPASVYLHEPGRFPRELQFKLVARLVGSPGQGPRMLAGCNGDPAEEVRAGLLIEDLYASLAVLTIHVPPLRERTADLPLLVQGFLERGDAAAESRVTGLTAEAWEVIRGHGWPGNLRELHAVLAAARRRAKGGRIDAADLPAYLRLAKRLEETPGRPAERPLPLDDLLRKAERRLIELALRRTGGHKTRAAEILSIWRMRLTRRMQALGIADADAGPTIQLELDEDADEA